MSEIINPTPVPVENDAVAVSEALQKALSGLTSGINQAINQHGGLEKKIQALIDADKKARTSEMQEIRREFAQTISSLDATCKQCIVAVGNIETRMVGYMGKLETLFGAAAKPMAEAIKMMQEAKLK